MRALRADITDYGPNLIQLYAPGAAKPRRPGEPAVPGLPAAPPPPPSPPTVRLWSFAMNETQPGDVIVTSPFFAGPAVLDMLMIQWDADDGLPRPSIDVFYSPAQPRNANDDPTSVAALGIQLFETPAIQAEAASQFQGPIPHLPKWGGGTVAHREQYRLRYPIELDRFQVSVRFGTQAAGDHAAQGYLRVLERVAPEHLLLLVA